MNKIIIEKIRQIQREEGNSPCFITGKSFCKWQQECIWSEICLSEFQVKAVHKFEIKE